MSGGSEQAARRALDGGVLIALSVGDPAAEELKKEILGEETLAFCSELAVVEMEYVLCRRAGWATAEEKRRLLLESRVVNVVVTGSIMDEAARLKCERALSLPDCFTLALAKVFRCKALFARKEAEMKKEIRKRAFDVEIGFLAP